MIFVFKVCIVFLIVILVSAYLSLIERKIIARIQLRLGPSYYSKFGLLQPIYDVIKLFFKRGSLRGHSPISIFSVCMLMLISLLSVTIIPLSDEIYLFNPRYGILYVILIYGAIDFFEILIGVETNSKYGIIGGVRAYFQLLLTQFPLILCLVCLALITKSFNFIEIVNIQYSVSFSFIITPIFIIYFIISLMVLNRTPFDFTEGESEIIAGNYVEYGGMLFAMIYLSEYVNLIFTSSIITILFMGGWNSLLNLSFIPPWFWMVLKTSFVMLLILTIRAVFPRYKQMQAIRFSWLIFCPIIIMYMLVFI